VLVPDEILMAFADGELPLAQRIQVERAVAADPEAQARIAMFRKTTALLRAAFAMEEEVVDVASVPGQARERAAGAFRAFVGCL
jgi:anti-sigma factor RsiW